MKDLDILSFGEPLYEFSQLPGAQQPVSYLSGYGGDTSNFAVSAASLPSLDEARLLTGLQDADANAAAALTTTGYGAVASIPGRAQVDTFLHATR
ncbi:hypothetical protein [Pantoea sp. App145]|uniref:hypothetical protein n=1 Tax=Pantoea sp. App145 TaxID=3071567 RepID=UPI003A805072